ncbi:hypothetical protein JOD54_004617 [Actinokineospora baliensis]|uniref:GNAT family N-acetyltransferase n=1 Tax=Actinokineospora baliensis TaxID=547056 RepID=UPI001956AB40|nr:GNAT family N-acetyltransferase [Actinokineospora baliensis]MBM7774413.1 hypothetical protein [Actinokineospora baliensis]
MPFALTSVTSISALGQAVWDRLAAGCSVYSCYPWLRYVETHSDAEVAYLVVALDGRPVAALPLYTFLGDAPRYYDPAVLFDLPRRRPLVVGGTREGYVSEILVDDDLSPADRRAAAGLLLSEVRDRAAASGGAGVVLYLPDHTVDLVSPLVGADDRLFVVDADAVIAVPPGGIDEHLDSLPARQRQFRREMRRFERSGCSVRVSRLGDCYTELGGLSAQLLGKYGRVVDPVAEVHRFGRQAAETSGISTVFSAHLESTMVGFGHFIRWGDTFYARSAGFDYSVAREASLYFNLLYYQAIQYASEHGIRWINYGCDAFDAKTARGARLRPLWALLLNTADHPLAHIDPDHEGGARLADFEKFDPAVRTPTVLAHAG